MLMSKLLGRRFKEQPADAVLDSHIFMLRGGYVRQVGNGIFTLLTPAKRIVARIEKIIREEMELVGGQEVLFPVVLPADLWKESGRFYQIGSELVRMKDRTGRDMCLGMTHEEAAVHLARTEAVTYQDYPFMIYQIQTKFRDEPRSRGGLVRVREFTMKDAYSFHTSKEDMEEYYNEVHAAYERIYKRVGLPNVISVQSSSGMMGGNTAHEFMFLSEKGEDQVVLCPSCGYHSNMEVAVSKRYEGKEESKDKIETPHMEKEEVHTPGVMDMEGLANFFQVNKSQFIKATVFVQDKNNRLLVVFIRGDYSVNESKLKCVLGCEVHPYVGKEESELCFGFIGPYHINVDNVDVLFDVSLEGEENLICGANRVDYHIKGVSMERDVKPNGYVDVYKVKEGDRCLTCGEPLSLSRGIEVGNIFQLGTKYTKSMDMTYLSSDNKQRHPVMGCYGIGVGRLFACLLEAHHDEYGPIWPYAVSPWQIQICALNHNQSEVKECAFELYHKLNETYDVILDDRRVAAGVMFADADLLGVPIRIVVSSRNRKNGEVEIVTRDKSVKMNIKMEDVDNEVRNLVKIVA